MMKNTILSSLLVHTVSLSRWRIFSLLVMGLLGQCSLVSAATAPGTRKVAAVEAEIASNAEEIKAHELAIQAWEKPDKLANLADASLLKLAQEREEAATHLNTINARWRDRYDEDPEAREMQKNQMDLSTRIDELGKTPGNEAEIKKLSDERQGFSAQLITARPRLEPELESLERIVTARSAEIFQKLQAALAKHPKGKKLLADRDQAIAKRDALDDEWLKLKGLIRPLGYLKAQTAPLFAKGHTMSPLSRYAYSLYDYDSQKELAERWGFCLAPGGYFELDTLESCRNSNTVNGRLVALVNSDPKRYRMQVITNRGWPDVPPQETWTRDADGKILNAQAKSMDGTLWSPGMDSVISPLAPDSLLQECARMRAEPIAGLRKLCPIAIILNGGEYGLGVAGFAKIAWERDPKIQKARGEKPWFDFISERKLHSEMFITNALKKAVPDRELYVYYTLTGTGSRSRWWGWTDWCYEVNTLKPIADIASDEHYLSHFNSGFVSTPEGLKNSGDILMQALNCKGRNIAVGMPLSYSWLWASANPDYERPRWRGLLKMLYTTGLVGANVGNYNFVRDEEFAKPFPPNQPPYWLDEIMAASHVQALFSHVENFIRAGELLPGPMQHAYSKEQPAYEFPTGDSNARVLARKLTGKPEWLISAWAADGADRKVTVRIPELGSIEVQARVCGSVYLAKLDKGMVTLVQLDSEGATFTKLDYSKPLVKPVDLAVAKPTSKGLMIWLAADAGVGKNTDGTVTSWTSQSTSKLKFTQPDAKHCPTWLADGVRGKPVVRFVADQQNLSITGLDAKTGAAMVGPYTVIGAYADAKPKNNRLLSALATTGGQDYENGICFTDDNGTLTPPEATDGFHIKVANGEIKGPLGSICVGAMCSGLDRAAMGGNGFGFGGNIAEILVYKGVLTPTEIVPLMDYFTDKYRPTQP